VNSQALFPLSSVDGQRLLLTSKAVSQFAKEHPHMDALATTNYVLAVSAMVATALTIAGVLLGKSGGLVMSLVVKPARMGKMV
jgi:hypothetical protein